MGMGGLVKQKTAGDDEGQSSTPAAKGRSTSIWGNFGRDGGGESSNPKDRKRSVAEVDDDEDRHIRFMVDGVGQRLTKDDFIRKMQALDSNTRKEVVEGSSASNTVKNIAKRDPATRRVSEAPARRGGAEAPVRRASEAPARAQQAEALRPHPPVEQPSVSSAKTSSDSSRGRRSESYSPARRLGESSRTGSEPETAVERRRRLAALEMEGDEDEGGRGDAGETPAERRRREAALGLTRDDDSEDEGTDRVPPARRNIRFADVPERGRQ